MFLNCGTGEISLLRVLWTAKSNQSVLKESNLEYSLEGLMLKLKHPILWPPDAKCQLTGKDPDDAGKDQKKRAVEDEMLVSIADSKDMNLSKLQETVKGREVLQSMGWQRVRHYLTTEQQQQQRPMSPVRWRMATSGLAQDSCSTALLSHQQ